MVLTLKLSDWVPPSGCRSLWSAVRGWGYRDVRTRQLVTGGQEVCLVALRRKALRRLRGKKSANVENRPKAAGSGALTRRLSRISDLRRLLARRLEFRASKGVDAAGAVHHSILR